MLRPCNSDVFSSVIKLRGKKVVCDPSVQKRAQFQLKDQQYTGVKDFSRFGILQIDLRHAVKENVMYL